MSLVKFNNRNRLFSWRNGALRDLLNYDPFFEDDLMPEDSLMPAMNVKEHDEDYEIEFAVPGFTKKDFDVSIDGDMLNVCGEKSSEKEDKEDTYSRKEFSYSSFRRSLKLPKNVNSDKKVKATYHDGILKLNLSKKEDLQPVAKQKIEIV